MVAPINRLQVLEVPGLAEARRRETEIRDRAFFPMQITIAGIPVRPFTLNHQIALEHLKNVFVVGGMFERPSERVAHAIQFIGIVSPICDVPPGMFFELRCRYRAFVARRFVRRLLSKNANEVCTGIRTYLDEALYDSPGAGEPSESGVHRVPEASFVASLIDDFYAAGYPFSTEDVLNMPMARLWQFWRLAIKRVHEEDTLGNPSDKIEMEHLAAVNAAAAAHSREGKD